MGSTTASSRSKAAPTPPRAEPESAERTQRIAASPQVLLGVPVDADPSDDYLMDKGAYVLSYGEHLRGPHWVAWRLASSDLGSARRQAHFHADTALPEGFTRLGEGAYLGSGFDRGHLCPSAHRTATRELNALTFSMSNLQPQLHALNAGPWEELETRERGLAARGKVLFIVAGGIFAETTPRLASGVAVPSASFRISVVLDAEQGPLDVRDDTPVLGAIVPNDPSVSGHVAADYAESVDTIEARTGYDFLSRLDDVVERAVEARRALP